MSRVLYESLNRRSALTIGSLPVLSLGMPQLMARGQTNDPAKREATARNCILVWLDGGPSHIDTLDPKPDAPTEVRGPFRSISTSITGIALSELMPQLAARLDQCALVRSLTSPLGEHNLGTRYMLTGYQPSPVMDHATFGSVLASIHPPKDDLPPFIAIPNFRVGGARFSGNGFLPVLAAPFEIGGDPGKPNYRVEALNISPSLDTQRLARRRRYLGALNSADKSSPSAESALLEKAFQLIASSKTHEAFALETESAKTRKAYGPKTIGQSCLLARRLVERGVSLVTINSRGWDTHQDLTTRLKDGFTGAKKPVGLVPSLDQAVAALIDDLSERGLIDSTLVVVMGEFGRTPKLNVGGGRDHWPRVFSALLCGGGAGRGAIVGSSDRLGESPKDEPCTPSDLAWTIYKLLGIDPHERLFTRDGRPVQIGAPGGNIIRQLIA